jgi:pyruvate/oxaloacetate carboxyltransferase
MRNTETLIVASKEVGLDVNVESTKYELVSRYLTQVKSRYKNSKRVF